ncbi:MAG: hypothetical protein IJ193_05985 [Bacilli bacterium]|nr:hypothetical protein [Bacilli bacterium]
MKELGIVILESGEVFSFGEYHCTIKRNDSDKSHFHDSAFRELLKTECEKFSYIEDPDHFQIVTSLPLLASHNCVVCLNASSGTFEVVTPMLIMVSPSTLSKEQKKSLRNMEETFNYFDNGLNYISMVDSTGEVTGEYNSMEEYYIDHLGTTYSSTFTTDNPYVKKLVHL